MQVLLLTALLGLSFLHQTTAQVSAIPQCAIPCFATAIQDAAICGLGDYYCQCTKGSKKIAQLTTQCLCKSDACSPAELIKVQKASDNICSSALAASDETYTPPATLGADACQATSGGSGAKSSGVMPNNATATTGTMSGSSASGSASGSASAAASSSSTLVVPGAAATYLPMLGYEGAVLVLGGLAMLAL